MNAGDLARFWSKVAVAGEDECWEWQGARSDKGYGVFWLDGRNEQAHRVAYQFVDPTLTSDQVVRHNCPGGDNKWCCNPSHLLSGTHQDNMRDAAVRRQMPFGERNANAKLTDHDALEIVRLYIETPLSAEAIGAMFGVTKLPVLHILSGKTWTHIERPDLTDLLKLKQRGNRLKGEENKKSVLTEPEVREIVETFKTKNVSAVNLAEAFGVSSDTIKKILMGKTWKHLNLDLPKVTGAYGDRHWTRRVEGTPAKCIECGADFKAINKLHRFCSDQCQTKAEIRKQVEKNRAARAANPLPPIPCPICGTPFKKTGNKQKDCSPKCNKQAFLDRQQQSSDAVQRE